MIRTLRKVIAEMKRDALDAQREADAVAPPAEGAMLFQAEHVKGAVAAAVADRLLYWVERLERTGR